MLYGPVLNNAAFLINTEGEIVSERSNLKYFPNGTKNFFLTSVQPKRR